MADEESLAAVLKMKETAVATSGDYENVVYDADLGEKVSHIVGRDPEVLRNGTGALHLRP